MVGRELEDMGWLDRVGGMPYIFELIKITSQSNAKHYADTIKKAPRKNRLGRNERRHGCGSISELDVDSIISSLMATDLTDQITSTIQWVLLRLPLMSSKRRWQVHSLAFTFGIKSMDDATGGACNESYVAQLSNGSRFCAFT